ncbi:NADH-quinone oxidoreductase subunit D [bacterium]|nr:NADH-quinone oxidoreductase subunit D [candidate division CSSED10-310 bacterium]
MNQSERLQTEQMFLQMGPSHPATHGCVKLNIVLEGERVLDAEMEIGYLHRAFEKMAEVNTYTRVIPYTDRMNYVSPMINNTGYVMAVEKLLDVEIPRRAQILRVIAGELSRLADHLTCLAAVGMELGAFTVFLYFIEARDLVWDLKELMCGARLTTSYTRIGGVMRDLHEDFAAMYLSRTPRILQLIKEVRGLLERNRIFMDRTRGIGVFSREQVIQWGITGPTGRASGFDYDVRRDFPYCVYDELDFEVPLGENGDNYDRFIVRVEEMYQSMRIIDQCLARLEDGPVMSDNHRIALPPKEKVYSTIEGMIHHFVIIQDGIKTPAGEAYQAVEGGNGELGFYLVSDGKGRAYRCRARGPCFFNAAAFSDLIKGGLIADIIASFGLQNFILGELDR